MSAAAVAALITAGLQAGTAILERMERGELTPEQAMAEWGRTVEAYRAASERWEAQNRAGG